MPEPAQPIPAWLIGDWAAHLTRAIESMAGEAPIVDFAAHELTAEDIQTGPEHSIWWEQAFTVGADVRIWIGAAPATWHAIGTRVLKSAGVEEQDQDAETVRGTYLEILTQALSGLASAISPRVRKEVSSTGGREGPPPSLALAANSFGISFGDTSLPLLAAFDPAWAAVGETPPPSTAVAAAAVAGTHYKPNSIDLLLDVELPVSVSFGRAQLALKDVIKLTTGSIVELNRAVSEPVEVIVNNCVIARGEVVVVEGNFGIKIKEVISRQERLRTLS